MSLENTRIGFIGLGVMGFPMARNLLKAGHQLTVHNRSPQKVEELVGLGATAAQTPRQVAEQCEIIITMLPDSPDVEAVALGPDGICEGVQSTSLVIDMSTIAPASAVRIHEEMGQKQVDFLDAPVSGGEKGATNATLSIMVGGSEQAFDRARPIFECLGSNILHIGQRGAGQITKACNQIVVALTIQAVSEAITLAEASGIDPNAVRTALLGGFAQSRVLDEHGLRMIQQNFTPGFRLRLHHKDLGIALSAADEVALPLAATSLVTQQIKVLEESGQGDLDHAALINLYRENFKTGSA